MVTLTHLPPQLKRDNTSGTKKVLYPKYKRTLTLILPKLKLALCGPKSKSRSLSRRRSPSDYCIANLCVIHPSARGFTWVLLRWSRLFYCGEIIAAEKGLHQCIESRVRLARHKASGKSNLLRCTRRNIRALHSKISYALS